MEVAKLSAHPNLEVRYVSCNESAKKRSLSSEQEETVFSLTHALFMTQHLTNIFSTHTVDPLQKKEVQSSQFNILPYYFYLFGGPLQFFVNFLTAPTKSVITITEVRYFFKPRCGFAVISHRHHTCRYSYITTHSSSCPAQNSENGQSWSFPSLIQSNMSQLTLSPFITIIITPLTKCLAIYKTLSDAIPALKETT